MRAVPQRTERPTASSRLGDCRGLSTVEYVILGLLIAIACVAAFRAFGGEVSGTTDESRLAIAVMEGEGGRSSDTRGASSAEETSAHAGLVNPNLRSAVEADIGDRLELERPNLARYRPAPPSADRRGATNPAPKSEARSASATSAPEPSPTRGTPDGIADALPSSELAEDPTTNAPRHIEAGGGMLASTAGAYRTILSALSGTPLGSVVGEAREMAASEESLAEGIDATEKEAKTNFLTGAYLGLTEVGRTLLKGAFESHDLMLDAALGSEQVGERVTEALRDVVHGKGDRVYEGVARAGEKAVTDVSNHFTQLASACRIGSAEWGTCGSKGVQTLAVVAAGTIGLFGAVRQGLGLTRALGRGRAVRRLAPQPERVRGPGHHAPRGELPVARNGDVAPDAPPPQRTNPQPNLSEADQASRIEARPLPSASELSDRLNGHTLEDLVGTGDWGEVYRVPGHPDLAIKVSNRHPASVAQIPREARGLERLRAAGVPTPYRYQVSFTDANGVRRNGIVMDLVDGLPNSNPRSRDWFTDRTLSDLRNLRDTLRRERLQIDDFQYMVGRDGRLSVIDPVEVRDMRGISDEVMEKSLKSIDDEIREVTEVLGRR